MKVRQPLKRLAPLLAFILCALSRPLAAQDLFDFELRDVTWTPLDVEAEIRGVVLDAATGEPISSAIVSIPGTMIGAMAEADGWFRIMDPPGQWNALEVASIGYTTRVVERPGPGPWAVRVPLIPYLLDHCGLEITTPRMIPPGHLQIRAHSVLTGEELPGPSVRATLHNLRDGLGSESVFIRGRLLDDGRVVEDRVLVRVRGVGAHILHVEADGFEPWWTAPINFTETNCQTPRSRAFDVWLVPSSGNVGKQQ